MYKNSQNLMIKLFILCAFVLLSFPIQCFAGQGNISGYCYYDDNENGIMDNSEPGIEGIKISLTRLFLFYFPVEVRTATTNADGRYEFASILNGSYFVKASSDNGDEASSQSIIKSAKILFPQINKIINFRFKRKVLPVSVSITASPQTVKKGQHSVLTWSSKNALKLTIDGIGDVAAEGNYVVIPEKTTEYKITAEGKNDLIAEDSVTVVVESPSNDLKPTVSISADPETIKSGETSNLKWSSKNAFDAKIDQNIGSVDTNGNMNVSPAITTKYTISVSGPFGSANASVTVRVEDDGGSDNDGSDNNGGYENSSDDDNSDDEDGYSDGDFDDDNRTGYEIKTAILLVSFDAEPGDSLVNIGWETGDENDNFGFNIYRANSEDGEYSRITNSVILSKAGSGMGTSYSYIDKGLKNNSNYFYMLENIDVYGTKSFYGPVSASPRMIYGLGQ